MTTYELNAAKEKLVSGRPISLMIVTMPSVPATQIWARSGVDVICFDMEHGVIDINSLHALIAATTGIVSPPSE